MLAVNGEKLNMTKKDDPFVKEVLEGFKIIRQDIKFPVTLKYTQLHISPKDPRDPESREERAQGIDIMLNANDYREDGVVQWTYFKSVQRKKDTDIFQPRKFTFNGYHVFSEKDIELVWFLLFKSPRCEHYPGLEEYQSKTAGARSFKLVIKSKDAQAREDFEKMHLRAKTLIYESEKKGGLGDDELKAIGKSLKLYGFEKLSMPELRNTLNDMYCNSRDPKKLKEFLAMAEPEISDLDEMIADLEDKNIIKRVISGIKGEWQWCKIEAGEDPVICTFHSKSNPVKFLMKELSNKEFLEKFNAAVATRV